MNTWELREQEGEALDRLRFATTEAAVFRNATILLMTVTGRAKVGIAPAILGERKSRGNEGY
jgi:hypothetical protein